MHLDRRFSGCIQITRVTACTLCIDPVGIDVEVCAAVKKFLGTTANFFDLDDAPAATATFKGVGGERLSEMGKL